VATGNCPTAAKLRRGTAEQPGTARVSLALAREWWGQIARHRERDMIPIRNDRRNTMQVREAMSDDVRITNPNQTIREAATLMAKIDAGSLPVGENDRLVGMITDRDIAVRAIAMGKGPDTPVRDVMSQDVKYCFEDDDLGEVAQNMSDIKVRRL